MAVDSDVRELELRLESKHNALKIAVSQRDAQSAALDELEQRWLDQAEAMRARGDLSGAEERSNCANELAELRPEGGPGCSATFEGEQCGYGTRHGGLHWTITPTGEVTWTEESVALHALATQLQRLADGVELLAVRMSESSKG